MQFWFTLFFFHFFLCVFCCFLCSSSLCWHDDANTAWSLFSQAQWAWRKRERVRTHSKCVLWCLLFALCSSIFWMSLSARSSLECCTPTYFTLALIASPFNHLWCWRAYVRGFALHWYGFSALAFIVCFRENTLWNPRGCYISPTFASTTSSVRENNLTFSYILLPLWKPLSTGSADQEITNLFSEKRCLRATTLWDSCHILLMAKLAFWRAQQHREKLSVYHLPVPVSCVSICISRVSVPARDLFLPWLTDKRRNGKNSALTNDLLMFLIFEFSRRFLLHLLPRLA